MNLYLIILHNLSIYLAIWYTYYLSHSRPPSFLLNLTVFNTIVYIFIYFPAPSFLLKLTIFDTVVYHLHIVSSSYWTHVGRTWRIIHLDLKEGINHYCRTHK